MVRIGNIEVQRVLGVVYFTVYENPYVSLRMKPKEAKEVGKALVAVADEILKERDGRG